MESPSQPESLLKMDPVEFFSVGRLFALGIPHNVAVRVLHCIEDMKYNDPRSTSRHYELSLGTMQAFLALYSSRYPFTQQADMGKKSVAAVVTAIKSAGLPFED